LTERQKIELLASPFKVIVSPFKAFTNIAQNPDVKGVILVAGLVLLATTGAFYAGASKLTWTVDDQFTSLLTSNMFGGYIISGLTEITFVFFTTWVIFAGALLFISRAFGQQEGSWRTFFVVIGYVLSVFIIRMAVDAFLISTLPAIPMSFPWPPATEEQANQFLEMIRNMWSPTLAYQLRSYVILGTDIWMVGLGAIAVRAMQTVRWGKALIFSVTAYLVIFMLRLYAPFLVF